MRFVGTLEADMATKIIIKFVIVIRKMPPQHLKKKSLSILEKKKNKKEQKYLRKKKHEFRFGLFGKQENKGIFFLNNNKY